MLPLPSPTTIHSLSPSSHPKVPTFNTMQFNLNLVRVLLLTALAAAQRANAALGCRGHLTEPYGHYNYLKDTTKCWADDINRVFRGSLKGCSFNGFVSVRSTLWRFLCVAPFVLLCYGLRDLFVFPSCRYSNIFYLSLDICSALRRIAKCVYCNGIENQCPRGLW